MTSDTRNPVKVVLDTNVLISALGFGGNPHKILQLVLEKKLISVTSPILFAEFHEVVSKKFPHLSNDMPRLETKLKKVFKFTSPKQTIEAVRDVDDNRVLEAAMEGNCQYIITGDKDLLDLKSFQNIQIETPEKFLKILETI